MDRAMKITLWVVGGLSASLIIGGVIWYKKNNKPTSTSGNTSDDNSGGSTSGSGKSNGGSSTSSSSYPNDGSPFVFSNKPLLRATFAGNDIQDVNGKVIGKVATKNQLLGVAEKVQSGFIYFVDKNANRNRIIWKGATVIDGK